MKARIWQSIKESLVIVIALVIGLLLLWNLHAGTRCLNWTTLGQYRLAQIANGIRIATDKPPRLAG